MELSLSREAASCEATEELFNILWNLKVKALSHEIVWGSGSTDQYFLDVDTSWK
jgi:hypothetical protein